MLTASDLSKISDSFTNSFSDHSKVIRRCIDAAKQGHRFVTIKERIPESVIVSLIKDGHFTVSQKNNYSKMCTCSFGCELCMNKETVIDWTASV